MLYIDTSVLVSALTPESLSQIALKWIERQSPGSIAISPWVTVELSAALSRKVRMNRLSEGDHDLALKKYTNSLLPNLIMLSIESPHFRVAAEIADQHTYGIRAPDALHIAVAGGYGAPLYTFDQRLASGASGLGYTAELIA